HLQVAGLGLRLRHAAPPRSARAAVGHEAPARLEPRCRRALLGLRPSELAHGAPRQRHTLPRPARRDDLADALGWLRVPERKGTQVEDQRRHPTMTRPRPSLLADRRGAIMVMALFMAVV